MRVFFDIIFKNRKEWDTMKERIKMIRKKNHLTQKEFGDIIGVKNNTITNYETGERNPSNAIITSICKEFRINKEWLVNGTGEMEVPLSEDEQITIFLENTLELSDDSLQKRLVYALSKLTLHDWVILEEVVKKLQ
jgi:transcriptional regulator with XRE-family HTH domain